MVALTTPRSYATGIDGTSTPGHWGAVTATRLRSSSLLPRPMTNSDSRRWLAKNMASNVMAGTAG